MTLAEASITIIGWDECPLFWVEDHFSLKRQIITPPEDKPMCLILASDIMEVCLKYDSKRKDYRYLFDCSGCSGTVRAEFRKTESAEKDQHVEKETGEIPAVVNLLGKFPFFKSLSQQSVKDIVSFLHLKKYNQDDIIIRKGEPGRNLFIIVSGKVQVIDDNKMSLATLGSGEVFGEMSLLSGDPVGATVKVLEPARVLSLDGQDFMKVLHRFPSLQMYLASLLARRLAQTNVMRSEELSSGMVGKLSEIAPSGLFQTLNLNQKTGLLHLELEKGAASISFREGEVVKVSYLDLNDEDAFFELLKMKDGWFKFHPSLCDEEMKLPPVRDFMGLLMEGIRRIDEEGHL